MTSHPFGGASLKKEIISVRKHPFRNYKSTELLAAHEEKKHHLLCVERATAVRGYLSNVNG